MSTMFINVSVLLWMDNDHGLCDGPSLQSEARQSHSLDADWIGK